MAKVTGIGGVFLQAKDPKGLAQWYKEHLGIPFGDHAMATFGESAEDNEPGEALTVFSFFKEGTDYFRPSSKPFMINFRVKDLVELLEQLQKEGVEMAGTMQGTRIWKVWLDIGS